MMKAPKVNLDSSNLPSFLKGTDGYAILDRYGDYPTNTISVFELVKEKMEKEKAFASIFVEALMRISTERDFAWLVVDYLGSLFSWHQEEKDRPFLDSWQTQHIADNLRRWREVYLNDKRWVGKSYSLGLWGEVQRMNKINHKEGYTLLPEEL
jgi:hypothetical protein